MSISLKVGDPLPSVGLRATDGYLLNLRSFVTKQPALYLFFAGPSARGAARQRSARAIEALSIDFARLAEAGIAAAAISADSEQEQKAHAESLGLPFLLLSDERRSAIELLGIETSANGGAVSIARPVALAVDREGFVQAVIDPVDPDSLADRAIRALSEPIPVG